MIKAIFACDENWGIGKNNSLPWPHNPEDLQWFKSMTNAQSVVMGRKTWESLPIKPLPNRLNFVITSSNMENYSPKPHAFYGGSDAKKIIKDIIEPRYGVIDDIWIIGGAQLFESCMDIIEEVHVSRIKGNYECDVFLPKMSIMKNYTLKATTNIYTSNLTIEKWIKNE